MTADLARRLGIGPRILPASDDPVRTCLTTSDGLLDFQDYFVRLRCAPEVREIEFVGAQTARPLPEVLDRLADDALRAVVLCPSNPFVSIEPILAVPGLREALRATRAPVVAVSPIVGGQAIKGPAAKMMRELGISLTASSVATRYADFLDGFVLDECDAGLADAIPTRTLVTRTLMRDLETKKALARDVLAFVDTLWT